MLGDGCWVIGPAVERPTSFAIVRGLSPGRAFPELESADVAHRSQLLSILSPEPDEGSKGAQKRSPTEHNPMRKTTKRRLLKLLIGAVLLCVLACWLDRASLFQEGNPLAIAPTLLRLETAGADILPVAHRPRLMIRKAAPGHRAIDRYLGQRGWRRSDQLGSLLPYRRGHESLNVTVHIYLHRRYLAYELSRNP